MHYANTAYLKTLGDRGQVNLEDAFFISQDADELFFSASHSPDENAGLLD